MRIGVRVLLGSLAVATVVAAVMLIVIPRTANDRPTVFRSARVVSVGPRRADPTPAPPTADPIDLPADRDIVNSANLFLTVDLVVVTGLGLVILLSVGWIVVRLVRGGEF
jgi:hypothetical protein